MVTPGSTRARVAATCSKVLWLSLRTITRQLPPRPESGPAVRGRSMVSVDITPDYAHAGRIAALLERARHADDHVFDAPDEAFGVLRGAEGDARGAAAEIPRGGVQRFADQGPAHISGDFGLALLGAAFQIDGAQPQHVGFVHSPHRRLVVGVGEVF